MRIDVYNPIYDEYASVDAFTVDDIRSLAFMAEVGSDRSISEFFESKITGNCNSLTKLLALVSAREKFIGSDLTLLANDGNSAKISMDYLVKSLRVVAAHKQREFTFGDSSVILDYPKSLYYPDKDSLMLEVIVEFSHNGMVISFGELAQYEKKTILNLIPASLGREIDSYISDSSHELILFKGNSNISPININLFNNSAFNFVKHLYRCYSYETVTELLYSFNKKIPDMNYLLSRTPREIEIITRLYEDEVAKAERTVKSL